jgi:hypothetical protein
VVVEVASWSLPWVHIGRRDELGQPVAAEPHDPVSLVDDPVVVAAQ